MPILDRRSPLTPANARNADVASKMVEHLAPMQQQKMMAAFRIQGIQAILYNKLVQGRPCVCHKKNNEVARLSPDGKASTGIINRVVTGNSNFGISPYSPMSKDLEQDPFTAKTSPLNLPNPWRGDLNSASDGPVAGFDQIEPDPILTDKGQFSPDLDSMFAGFDMSQLGFSDISCPICFGTGYAGGYSPFRAWRHVVLPTELDTYAFYDLPTFELSPGSHKVMVTLPKGATTLDCFRAMLNSKQVPATLYLDGVNLSGKRVLDFFDGKPHELTIETEHPITHFEMQVSLSREPVYFEIPKLTRSSDLSLLDQQEPFQIVVSPDIPMLQTLDVIAEAQLGKILVVQQANPWNTRSKNMLGYECTVRVAQPAELWNILPRRRTTGQKRTLGAAPSKSKAVSGVTDSFSF